MKRTIRSLVLAGGIAIWAGCEGTETRAPVAWYEPELVERMAPGCLEAGYDPVVCGCVLHHMGSALQDGGYVPFEMTGWTKQGWPGDEGGALARWHASCETWAAVLGSQEPQVSAGPTR